MTWKPLRKAFEYVLAHEHSRGLAARLLLEELASGRVKSRAGYIVFPGGGKRSNAELSGDFWIFEPRDDLPVVAKVNWEDDSATLAWWHSHGRCEAYQIDVDAADLFQRWPRTGAKRGPKYTFDHAAILKVGEAYRRDNPSKSLEDAARELPNILEDQGTKVPQDTQLKEILRPLFRNQKSGR
jgi:hypothetical protein